MRQFQCVFEANDHEGETWRFYIPLEGNEEALSILAELLDEDREGNRDACLYDYGLGGVAFEDEVDTLEKFSDGGYTAAHNKLDGKLDVTPLLSATPTEIHAALYKGGIRDFVR